MTRSVETLAPDEASVTADYLDELNLQAAARFRKGTTSFGRLVHGMDGAYPTDVLIAVKSLQDAGDIPDSFLESVNGPDGSPCADDINVDMDLGPDLVIPEPHPLDYDWRFTTLSLSVLAGVLDELGTDRIAALGAPTLYLHLWRSGKTASLFDQNARLLDQFRKAGMESLVCCDLLNHPPFKAQFDAVVADPPWYLDHYTAFIGTAHQLLAVGGFLLISVLPRLTRPTASHDRKRILDFANDLGFDLLQVMPAILSYSSPPFEVSSLKAVGLWSGNWRTGDLFIFKKTTRQPKEMVNASVADRDEWASFAVGSTSVRVKRSTGRVGRLLFEPASLTGDVYLHSVSRRSPARSSIDLWTSRNLALKITRPEYLAEVLLLAEGGMALADAIYRVAGMRDLDAASTKILCDIVRLLVKDGVECET
jgi:SAM-dependent methyltransferase